MSAEGWVLIIAAIGYAVKDVVILWLASREREAKRKDQEARDAADAKYKKELAGHVTEVKTTLADTSAAQDKKLDELGATMEQVKVATNGLTDKLIESTGKEAYARGEKHEKDKR